MNENTVSNDIKAKVTEFHLAINQPVIEVPIVPTNERVRLRARLITEEFIELLQALYGRDAYNDVAIENVQARLVDFIEGADPNVDLPDAADALADLAYVIEGTNIELGIDSRGVLDVVHFSNMSKVGGPIDEHGKQRKPEGWKPPDIVAELRRQGADL